MASFVRSIGYGVGKLHTGLIRYLCELWNEGSRSAVQPFFDELGIRLDDVSELRPTVEEKCVDLVIRGVHKASGDLVRLAMIEMKVDDHENKITRGKLPKGYQTEIYPQLLSGFATHHFVTLGGGEYYSPPKNGCFDWIRLERFARAVGSVTLNDPVIRDWSEMLNAELALRQKAANAISPPDDVSGLRTGIWNLYLLGSIKERLLAKPEISPHIKSAKAYFYGSRPDTILNFGGKPCFAEINYSGRLNLKIHLSHLTPQMRSESIGFAHQHYVHIFKNGGFQFQMGSKNLGKNTKRTKTLLSFDIGLANSGYLYFAKTPDETCNEIIRILSVFFVEPFGGKS